MLNLTVQEERVVVMIIEKWWKLCCSGFHVLTPLPILIHVFLLQEIANIGHLVKLEELFLGKNKITKLQVEPLLFFVFFLKKKNQIKKRDLFNVSLLF